MHLCVFTVFAFILFFQIHPYVKYLLDIQNLIEGDFLHHWIGTRKWNKMRANEGILFWRFEKAKGISWKGGCNAWYAQMIWEYCIRDVLVISHLYVWCDRVYFIFVYQCKIHPSNHMTNKIPSLLNPRLIGKSEDDIFMTKMITTFLF